MFFPPARSILSIAILVGISPLAQAGSVIGGATHTVNAGDPVESWGVQGASTLNLANGSATQSISVAGRSFLNTTGATIVAGGSATDAVQITDSSAVIKRSAVSSISGNGFTIGTTASNLVGSDVTITDSSITGLNRGVSMASGSSLAITGSTVTATAGSGFDGGITTFGGSVSLSGGSVVQGNNFGVSIRMGDNASAIGGRPGDGTLLIDGSRVVGGTGSAINVTAAGSSNALHEFAINVRNGSELVGGNGTILSVSQGPSTSGATTANFSVESSVLNGNVVVATDGSIANVTMGNGGRINGAFTNVTTANVADGGHWQLTDSSNVGAVTLAGGGVIGLGDGASFHTLTTNGFTGNGGTLQFNTVLGPDGSATDRLHVLGDTNGQAQVSVNNIGGAGAQTVEGIQLIQVDGASNAQFQLAGRAVGGQYEYFLYKGGASTPADGGWYLRSQLPTAPDPCAGDPTLPGCTPVGPGPIDPVIPVEPPLPVLRPEPGAYLANLHAAQQMFTTDYHSRHAGQNSGRAWLRVDGQRTGFDASDRQLDISGNSQSVHVGADLIGSESGSALGVMLATGNATSTSVSNQTGYWARGKVKGNALGIYGTWRGLSEGDSYGGMYLDGWVQRQAFRNRVEGVGLAAERYDSKAWQGAFEAGYAFRLSGDAAQGGLYLEPQLQLGYTDLDMDTHVESNGTVVSSDRDGGLFGRAGLRLSGFTSGAQRAAIVQPYLQINWLYNRNNDAISFDGDIADTRIPKSRVQAGGGASLKFTGGLGAWGGVSVEHASGYHAVGAQVGMSYRW